VAQSIIAWALHRMLAAGVGGEQGSVSALAGT